MGIVKFEFNDKSMQRNTILSRNNRIILYYKYIHFSVNIFFKDILLLIYFSYYLL